MEDKFKSFDIEIRRITAEGWLPEEFAQKVCELTFLGKSNISLDALFRSEHSPVRSQQYFIVFKNIPLFISTHFIRHHVGSIPFQLTCRDDRKGGNVGLKSKLMVFANSCLELGEVDEEQLNELYGNIDRYTKVNLGIIVNAQALIDMAKLRLCHQSHRETIFVMNILKQKLSEVAPELTPYLVPKCVYRGGICGEPNACKWNKTKAFQKALTEYLGNFEDKQISTNLEKYKK